MKRVCEWCGIGIMTARADARYCSSKHRIYAHRAKPALPAEMTNANRWIRYSDPVKKIPLTAWGEVASSTNSATWTSYGEAKESDVGAGLGFVLGYGIGCIDLDHCMIDGQPTEAAREFVADYPQNYIEVSPSGHGLHVWGEAEEAPGTKRTENGLSVERYSTGRYITITGNVYQRGTLQPL